MAGYAGLQRVPAGPIYDMLKHLTDELQVLRTRVVTLETTAVRRAATIDAASLRISNLAHATAGADAVTLDQLRAQVDAVKKATY